MLPQISIFNIYYHYKYLIYVSSSMQTLARIMVEAMATKCCHPFQFKVVIIPIQLYHSFISSVGIDIVLLV